MLGVRVLSTLPFRDGEAVTRAALDRAFPGSNPGPGSNSKFREVIAMVWEGRDVDYLKRSKCIYCGQRHMDEDYIIRYTPRAWCNCGWHRSVIKVINKSRSRPRPRILRPPFAYRMSGFRTWVRSKVIDPIKHRKMPKPTGPAPRQIREAYPGCCIVPAILGLMVAWTVLF